MDQLLLRRAALGRQLGRVFVAQVIQVETAALGDLDRPGDGVGVIGEQPRHFGRRFQMPLRIGEQAITGLVKGAVLADAGEDVLQRPALRHVHVHVVGGDERRAAAPGEVRESGQPADVVAAIEAMAGEIGPTGKRVRQTAQRRREAFALRLPESPRRQRDDDLPLAMVEQVVQAQMALPLGRAALAEREQPRQPAIGRPVGRIDQEAETRACPSPTLPRRGRFLQIQPRADDEAEAGLLRRHMRAHHSRQAAAVGEGDRSEAEPGRGLHQLVRVRGAAQEAEVAGDLQLGIGREVSGRRGRRHGGAPSGEQPVQVPAPCPARPLTV